VWAGEAAKWEKITYVGIVTCAILTIFNLSKGHPHYEEPPVSVNILYSVFKISMPQLHMKTEIHIDDMFRNSFH